jgi:negative regulator of sigma E activity|tara:strand:+ start:528 stop:1469 length:942 start_codon:yes stop_codon:yes gene_type:complete
MSYFIPLKIKLNQLGLLASNLGKLNLGNDILTAPQINAESIRESLSAVMDDAAQPLELQRVLKASQDHEQVRQQWSRYQLASAALKREASDASLTVDLAHRVRQAIEAEPTYTQIAPSKPKNIARFDRIWQPVAGLAVAASVAMVMVLGAQRVGVAVQPQVMPAQQGVVLLEPRHSNNSIALSSTGSSRPVVKNVNNIIRLPTPVQALNAAQAGWVVETLPAGFVLTQRSLDTAGQAAREVLTYSDGNASFTLYIEALNGRTIAEGHAFAGSNLVLGQSMADDGKQIFVTLVGQLSLAQGEQVAGSVVSFKPK